jgi:hypothetical protein
MRGERAEEAAISGLGLLLAIGFGAARRVHDRVVEPLAATASGVSLLAARIVTDEDRHPRLAGLSHRTEQLRAELAQSAESFRGRFQRDPQPVAATATVLAELTARIITDEDRHPRLARLSNRTEQLLAELQEDAKEPVRRLLRWTVEHTLAALDVTTLVLRYVDLDTLAAGLDIDAVIDTMDLNGVAAHLDLNALISRVDLEAVLSRVDLNAVLGTVDLDAILMRIDPNSLVSRVDLDTVLSHIDLNEVVSRIDLNEVASRIDLDAILMRVEPDTVVARVDIDAVLERVDVASLAREVLDAIDLPDVMRQSSGAVSSQTARVVRAEGMQADASVARFIDRVLHRPVPPPRGELR